MTTGMAILVLTAFLASAVEAVEALTVVLAVGVTQGSTVRSSRKRRRPEPRSALAWTGMPSRWRSRGCSWRG
jgi:hypothetical protein